MRKNGNAGIETQSNIPYQEPRDLNISQTYFVENKGPGLLAHQRLLHGHGLRLREQRRLRHQARQRGPPVRLPRQHLLKSQPYLVEAFLNGGSMMLDGCRIEGYGGFRGQDEVRQDRAAKARCCCAARAIVRPSTCRTTSPSRSCDASALYSLHD